MVTAIICDLSLPLKRTRKKKNANGSSSKRSIINMTIESAPRHDSRSDLSQYSSDDKFTQPEGCGYQKHNNNPIFGDNLIVIIINVRQNNDETRNTHIRARHPERFCEFLVRPVSVRP